MYITIQVIKNNMWLFEVIMRFTHFHSVRLSDRIKQHDVLGLQIGVDQS